MSAFPSAAISLPRTAPHRTAPHRTVGLGCSMAWRHGPLLFLLLLLKTEFVLAHSTGSECIVPDGVTVGSYQTAPGWWLWLSNRTCIGDHDTHTLHFHVEAANCIANDLLCWASPQSRPTDFTLQIWRGTGCPDNGFIDPAGGQGKCSAGLNSPRNFLQCPMKGNPIAVGIGNKHQQEVDFEGTQPTPDGAVFLQFVRYYNSDPAVTSAQVGSHWRHTYDRKIVLNSTGVVATVSGADGTAHNFRKTSGEWGGEREVRAQLTRSADGSWQFRTADNHVETYDSAGRLTLLSDPQNRNQSLHYDDDGDPSTLDRVVDPLGRMLVFSYTQAGGSPAQWRLAAITLPDGSAIEYRYTAAGRLDQALYPMPGGQQVPRSYLYENSSFPNALTGIVDERGIRYATFGYDAQGRANLTEHAGGAGRVSIDYHVDGTATSRTQLNAGGQEMTETHHFALLHGVRRLTQSDGACASCGAQAVTYDSNDRIASRTDRNGNKTLFGHDASGREVCRIEGLPPAGASTAGAPRKRIWVYESNIARRAPLEERLLQPDAAYVEPTTCSTSVNTGWSQIRSTVNTYALSQRDRIKTRTGKDTLAGSAFDRVTTYAYWGETVGDPAVLNGLLKSINGPRTNSTGFSDVTRYFYATTLDVNHKPGDLIRVEHGLTSTVFLSTYIDKHDGNGRPLEIRDANNALTVITYHPRGWLTSRTVDGQQTLFAYDNVGQVDRITLPTGAWIDYDYDGARRLTDVRDNLGNLIHYDLDLAGNRIGEQVKDPGGNLKREVDRVYNSLNQLQQLVGGMGQTTNFTYDATGNVARRIDPRDPAPASPAIYTGKGEKGDRSF